MRPRPAAGPAGMRGEAGEAGESERRASLRRLYGTDEPPPEGLALRAGPLDLRLVDGALRDLRRDGEEVWHAVTFPLRDPDWWTPGLVVDDLDHRASGDGFQVLLRGRFATAPAVAARLLVVGRAEGSLRVEAEAVPEGDLAVNRLGLCLLYPTMQAGAACEVLHDDGRTSRSTFPTLVPPWPPFTGVRGIRHEYAPGRWASCRFEGDSFEFEDQRNNADASFKVYNRSNMMPRPYRLRAGEPVRQALELRLEAAPAARALRSAPAPAGPRAAPPSGSPSAPPPGPPSAPRIGIALSAAPPGRVAATGARIGPDYLHLVLGEGERPTPALVAALRALGRPVHLEADLGEVELGRGPRGEVVADLAAALEGVALEAVVPVPGGPDAVRVVRRHFPGVPVGGGTPHYFAQINRAEGLGPVDFLTFTVSPLVHGADDASVMASPSSLPGMVATLVHRRPGLPVRLGPSALAMRASPLGRLPACAGTRRMAMAADDPRARGLFGAAWVLALAAAAAQAGVAAATLMALDGPSAVLADGDGRADDAACWHPAAAVLARLGGAREPIESPVPGSPARAALAFRRDGRREVLVADLSGAPSTLALEGWARQARRAVLDEAALRAADDGDAPPAFLDRPVAPRLDLAPYAVAHLVLEDGVLDRRLPEDPR